jgi:hypothetical protein
VALVVVDDVGDPVEPRPEPGADLLLADQPLPAGRRPARGVEHAVLGEEGHDRVEVVGVERVEQGVERRGRRLGPGHGLASL